MSQELRVGLLGSLTIDTGDGRPVGLPSATQRRLLSVLALEADHVVSAPRLCELLKISNGSLRTTVSRLRSTVVGDHVVTSPPGYLLDARTDLAEFEQLVERGRAAEGADPIELLGQALALWRGQPLEEFCEESWVVGMVERLHELRAVAVESRAGAQMDARRADLVVAEMRAHAADHPLRERPRMILMRALAQEGRATEALRVYQDHRRHLVESTGTEPSDAIRSLERSIAADLGGPGSSTGATASHPRPTNLPAQRTSLIGREELVDRVVELVCDHRLVSLIGPGGVGKTRLAIEAAGRTPDDFPGGVFFVDLTAATDGSDVSGVLVRSTSAPVRPAQPDIDAVAELLAGRTALLVVDNCEHVIDAAAELIDDVLIRVPGARVLATTREPLRLHGERRCIVPSLDVDGPDSAGARLFVDRAALVDEAAVDEVLVDEAPDAADIDAASIVEIARRLDGIPLAIELAAAQVAAFSPAQILELLDDRFALLDDQQRRVPLRHQTLAATLDWSYELLSDDQRRTLRTLSACAGACSPGTAARVLGRPLAETERLLHELVAKSLLVPAPGGRDPVGFTFLETVREYGRAMLSRADEMDAAQLAVESALLPPADELGDWTSLVNDVICAADPAVMVEASTRLAAAADAQDAGRLGPAAFLFASVAFRDEIGPLRARASMVRELAGRRDELDPLGWRVATAASLLFERSGRDYGAVMTTAATMTEALAPDDPARSWFELWQCALTTAVDPGAGLAAVEAALPDAERHARPPLDWTLSQYLGVKATGQALLGRLDETHTVAAEAARWAPVGQESRDQALALRAWLGYLDARPVDHDLVADVAAQDHGLGLAELCAAPGVLHSVGTPMERGERLLALARQRPAFDIATPFLLAFAWLALELDDRERARRLVANAELFDASTQVALVYALAAIEDWRPDEWTAGRDAAVASYLGPEHELATEHGAAVLDDELDRWERLLAGAPSETPPR